VGYLTRSVPRPSVFSMRAAVFQGVGRPLAIQDAPDPEPGPAELVLAVGRDAVGHFRPGDRVTALPYDSFPATVEALRTDKSRVKVMLEPR